MIRPAFWTDVEMQTLVMMWNDGRLVSEICKVLGRPKQGVEKKTRRMGLSRRGPNPRALTCEVKKQITLPRIPASEIFGVAA